MVRVVGLGSQGSYDPEFKSPLAVELTPGGVDSARHPSEVSKMSASLLVSCVGVVTLPVLCPMCKETALAAQMLCTEYGPNGWMDGIISKVVEFIIAIDIKSFLFSNSVISYHQFGFRPGHSTLDMLLLLSNNGGGPQYQTGDQGHLSGHILRFC